MTQPLPVRVPTGARWSCRSCGDCCRGFHFGPVEPEIIAGLEAADIGALWPPAGEAPWHERRTEPDGTDAFYLTRRDDHCVFLDGDNLCAVHRLLGGDKKPSFCREYPFHVVSDDTGLAVVARADCGGLHESFRDGDPLEAQIPAVLALPQLHPRRHFAPETVVILPGLGVSAGDWLTLEGAVLRDLDAERRPPGASVAVIRERLGDLVNRPPPPPDPARFAMAMGATLHALDTALRMAAEQDPGDSPFRAALVREGSAAVQRARAALAEPWPALDADAVDYLHLVLRSDLLSKQFTAVGGVPFGLGLFLVTATIARLGCEAEPPLSPSDLGSVLPRFKRLLANRVVLHILRQARPALGDVFLHSS